MSGIRCNFAANRTILRTRRFCRVRTRISAIRDLGSCRFSRTIFRGTFSWPRRSYFRGNIMDETRRVVAEYFAALRAMDADACANTFAEDAVSHDPVGAPPHH